MKQKLIPIVIVIVVGLVLGALILTQKSSVMTPDSHGAAAEGTAKAAGSPVKGPKGGKLFSTDGFGLEVTIFETGVEPQFRLYLYQDGKPLAPTAAGVALTLSRLGAAPQAFNFKPEAGYLLGDQVVDEPHSFDVAVAAAYKGKTYRWGYSQVEARVEMPDAVLQSTGVEIREAGPAMIQPTLNLPGEIMLNAEKVVHVIPRLSGVVLSVTRDVGQTVKQGDVLAVIESQGLAELRSQYFAARKRLSLARTSFEREKKLWEEKITAQQDYLEAQQAFSEAEIAHDLAAQRLRSLGVGQEGVQQGAQQGGALARFEVRAPISGVIVTRNLAAGTSLKEDADIFTVADLSTVWAQITVYPKDLGTIKVGQKVMIKASAFEAQGTGTVSYIGALVGEQTRTAQARVTLSNPQGVWRPGMFVSVEIAAAEVQVPIAVSVDAIQTVRDWTVVFGRYGQFFEARPLELGRSDGQMVEVLKGLSAGEKYGAGNSFAIKADLGKSGASHDH